MLSAVEEGRISLAHAHVIAKTRARVAEADLPRFARDALTFAVKMSPGRLRRRLQELVAALSPESQETQTRQAYAGRSVWVEEYADGMAMLGAILPAPLAIAAADRVTQIAKQTMHSMPKGTQDDGVSTQEEDERTLDQARADVLAELLLASTSTREHSATGKPYGLGIDAKIQVSVPVTALARRSSAAVKTDSAEADAGNDPESSWVDKMWVSELAGYGIIDSDIARMFALDASSWERIFVNDYDQVIATDNYKPTARIRSFLTARDQRCRFPGCMSPPSRCEIDHTFDWVKGGKTRTDNLALLCRRHHLLKHPSIHVTSRWQVTQHAGGVMEWTSPDGQVFQDIPDPAPTTVGTSGDPGGHTPSGQRPLVVPKPRFKRVVRLERYSAEKRDPVTGEVKTVTRRREVEKMVRVVPKIPQLGGNTSPWGDTAEGAEWPKDRPRPF